MAWYHVGGCDCPMGCCDCGESRERVWYDRQRDYIFTSRDEYTEDHIVFIGYLE